jgi:hypothetical protein
MSNREIDIPEIPEDAMRKIAPAMQALKKAFRPLLRQLEHGAEPATIFSESAVLGE